MANDSDLIGAVPDPGRVGREVGEADSLSDAAGSGGDPVRTFRAETGPRSRSRRRWANISWEAISGGDRDEQAGVHGRRYSMEGWSGTRRT